MSVETLSAAVVAYLNLLGSGQGSQEQREAAIRAMVAQLDAAYVPDSN